MTGSGFGRLIRRIVPERFRPIGYLTHLARERTGGRVRTGPFTGMRFGEVSVGSAYIPKLLGTYEQELAPCVDAIVGRQPPPRLIVDVGAAEGYYAVGLALRIPEAAIVAFEMNPAGREALGHTARINGVSKRLSIRGKCEPDDLQEALQCARDPIIICDVEGYEEKLLDPEKVPALIKAEILVEMHDFIVSGISDEILGRFAATHAIHTIWQEPRDRIEFPWRTIGTTLLPRSYLDWAVSEWRPVRMSWLWLIPREPSQVAVTQEQPESWTDATA